MTNEGDTGSNNYTEAYNNLFTYGWNIRSKSPGNESSIPIDHQQVTFLNNKSSNFGQLPWMDDLTKQFYYILRTPTEKDIAAHGLLYTTPETTYMQVKVNFCVNATPPTCLPADEMARLSNFGRFFLFVQYEIDNSTVSREEFSQDDHYYLYNFFIVPNYYKRVTINFQVRKTEILPDYFFRFRTEYNLRLGVESIVEEVSVVNSIDPGNTDAIAFNFQLAPLVSHTRVTYETLLDHISMWGALFGVLFSVFALVFYRHNRSKYYRRNPDWDKFKPLHHDPDAPLYYS